ncbi:MAG: nuclear transport factor 2 family protein [Cyclobacteriaceae bacterium]|nr:nuclear transport factor 2 family protein [Cyclobacteriaceae bacterium HetDA_MAG_MS6]
MKYLAIIFLISIQTSTEKEKLLNRLESFNEAFISADAEKLASMITADYMHSNGSSGPYNKKQWLNYVKSRRAKLDAGTLTVSKYEMQDIQVILYGAAATISGKVVTEGLENGKSYSKIFLVTHTWVLQDGYWHRAAFHDGKLKN